MAAATVLGFGGANAVPQRSATEEVLFANTRFQGLVTAPGAAVGHTAIAAAYTAVVRFRRTLRSPRHITAIKVRLTNTCRYVRIITTRGLIFKATISTA